MKKLFLISVLIGLGLGIQAQVGGIVYDPKNYSAALDEVAKTGEAVSKLEEQNTLLQHSNQQLLELRHFQDSIQRERLSLLGLKGLQWADLEGFSKPVQELDMGSDGYIPAADLQTPDELYNFLFAGDEQFNRLGDIKEYEAFKGEQLGKRQSVQKLIKKQQLHQAMIYIKLAEAEVVAAEELRRQLTEEDVMSLSEGERILALDAVKRSLVSSVQLRDRANELLLLAMQPDPIDELYQQQQEAKLRLRSVREQFQNLIPGYKSKKR